MRNGKWIVIIGGFAVFAGLVLNAGMEKNPDKNTLWMETFKDDAFIAKWRKGGFSFKVEDGLFIVDPRNAENKKNYSTGRYVAYDAAYPYFQLELESVEQLKGYRGWTLSSASTGCRGTFTNSAGGVIPGIWTFKIDDCLALQKEKGSFFLRVDMHGYVFKYKYLKMMKSPVNAIIATTDKKVLKPGDVITFKLLLADPCKDATINIRRSYGLSPMKKINEAGYVQMTSDDRGKTWIGKLKITKRGFRGKKLKACQLIFSCNMLGGKLRKVFTSNSFEIDCSGN